MHTILNALSLACAESSIGSMQVGFLMALAGVPVRELFIYVGHWRRMRDVMEVDPLNHISN